MKAQDSKWFGVKVSNPRFGTKQAKILGHFRTQRTLTNLEAIALYGDYRLSGTVEELRKKGFNIEGDQRVDPLGRQYTRYILRGKTA